jgi:hypothetical protein
MASIFQAAIYPTRNRVLGGLHFTAGTAHNYGDTEAVTFVKQFFVGGPGVG